MNTYTETLQETNSDIAQLVAQSHLISKTNIFPYADNNEFLTELFTQHDCDGINILSVGASTPDIAIAADKANMEIKELIGKNPFNYTLYTILQEIKNGDIVYVANPSKVTGANFSLTGLNKIIEKNKDGLVLIDEYYFDFYGITGLPLINDFENLIILRSFTSAFGIYSSDAGYAIASNKLVKKCKEMSLQRQFSTILRRTILATMANPDSIRNRLHDIREEALRITKNLTAIGIQCRITATDFLLMRVASPKDVGNYLNSKKVEIDNLCGYPKMSNYIRFHIESYFSNNRLIESFKKMPESFYKMKSIEKQPITLRKPASNTIKADTKIEELLLAKTKIRTKSPENINDKHTLSEVD